MSGIRLLTNSVYAGRTITASSGAATAPYLNDKDAGPQWVAADTAAQTLAVDVGAGAVGAVSALALIHHNLMGGVVSISGSADNTAWTDIGPATITVDQDPFIVALPLTSYRYFRVVIPAGGAAPARIGELMLGVGLAIIDNPNLPSGKPGYVANVAHDRSPAGYPWNTRKGQARRRYEYEWHAMPGPDWATLVQAFRESGEGANPLVLTDQLGNVVWVTWEADPMLGPPGALGVDLFEVSAVFEEIPQ